MFQYKQVSEKSNKFNVWYQESRNQKPDFHHCRRISYGGCRQPVIQRMIVVANHNLEKFGADYIYHKCEQNGLSHIAQKKFSLEDNTDFVSWINKMLKEDTSYCARSYAEFNLKLCSYIARNMPPRCAGDSRPPSHFSLFTSDALAQEYPCFAPESLYRPLSPVAAEDDDLRRFRTEASVGFHIGTGERNYHVGGPGRFLSGVGTYRELLSDVNIVDEVKGLLSGNIAVSRFEAANQLYALIVGVEGCARSVHNIALARIFFENYKVIAQTYPDKSLFELAARFLTFVSPGGASLSASYASNMDELNMLLAHCAVNGVSLTAESISDYLIGVSQEVISRSGIQTLYSFGCDEVFAVMEAELRRTDFFRGASDEEIRAFLLSSAEKRGVSEMKTLYDWETEAGIWYLLYAIR